MSVWFYYLGNYDSNVGIENVMFFNFNPNIHHLSVKYYDGRKELFENVDFISNVYDSKMEDSQHEILPI